MLRILVSTDINLGYAEKDPVKRDDSFNTFKEILRVGVDEEVDMVLLGGNLFHHNKPSMYSVLKCMQILRNHVLGNRPLELEYMSDPMEDFAHCNSKTVNYMSENINVALPIFSIHGTNDDPSGLGATSSLDIFHEAGLVNYFGKYSDLNHIKVKPVLLKKGNVKVALYGLSHIKDEKLHRMFRENRLEFLKPKEDPDSWFNILLLHQNRAKKSATNYIPEDFIPDLFDLVIWGHEHECRIELERIPHRFSISQPGSTVATTLCEAEAIEKKVGVLKITKGGQSYRPEMNAIALKTVRPLMFKTICLTDLSRVDFSMKDLRKLADKIETELRYEVEELLSQADEKLTGCDGQGTEPLVRLRVEYTEECPLISPARFGNHFLDTICNPADILVFKKKPERKVVTDNFDLDAMGQLPENNLTMEDLVEECLQTQRLSVLDVKAIGKAVKMFVDKDDKDALKYTVEANKDKAYQELKDRENMLSDVEEEEEEEEVASSGLSVSKRQRIG